MSRDLIAFPLIALLCFSLFIAQPPKSYANNNEDLTAEKLVAAHVKSLGNPALLAKVQSRMFLGNTDVEFILGNTGTLKGNSMFVSQGPKIGDSPSVYGHKLPRRVFCLQRQRCYRGHHQPRQEIPRRGIPFSLQQSNEGRIHRRCHVFILAIAGL